LFPQHTELVLEMFLFFRAGRAASAYYDFRKPLNADSAADGKIGDWKSMGLKYGDGVSPPHFGRVWGPEYFVQFLGLEVRILVNSTVLSNSVRKNISEKIIPLP